MDEREEELNIHRKAIAIAEEALEESKKTREADQSSNKKSRTIAIVVPSILGLLTIAASYWIGNNPSYDDRLEELQKGIDSLKQQDRTNIGRIRVLQQKMDSLELKVQSDSL